MQHPTYTARTYALRVGKWKFALELGCFFAILAAVTAIACLVSSTCNVGGIIVVIAMFAVMTAGSWFLVPRQVVRVSPQGIRVRSFGLGKYHRISWEQVEACSLGTRRLGVRSNSCDVTFGKGMIHKDDWPELHETMSHYFEYLFGITPEVQTSRRKELLKHKSAGHMVLDKAALIFVALSYPALMFTTFGALAWSRYRLLLIAGAVVTMVAVVLIMRRQIRFNKQLSWCPTATADN